jgi:hypothetical protein
MAEFYDWHKTLSYDADVTMVIGARGVGKTFGIRTQCIRDWIKDGSRFVEVVRFKNELSGVADGYFNRVGDQAEFDDYIFRTDARYGWIAEKPEETEDDKKVKPDWHLLVYFIALSDAQRMKKRTFDKVRRIIFDESILERSDRYHNYLPNEFGVLANLVDTVSRERADTISLRPRVYLLGNACDLSNPYFANYGVGTDLKFGYRWYAHKTFLLHYVDAGEYAAEKLTGTVAGRMMQGTSAATVAISNEFVGVTKEFVRRKPSRAKFSFGIVCDGKTYGIWVDIQGGLYYVTNKLPKDANSENFTKPIYALTADDNKINYIAAKRANKTLSYFAEMYYLNLVRYDSVQTKSDFRNVLALFGIR